VYSKTPDASILEEAFSMAEKSKAVLLLENTRDQRAKTMAGVPDSLVSKERDIRIELTYYKTNLYQAQKNKDSVAIAAFEKHIFDSERKLEQFKSQLEKGFPTYYKLKYNTSTASLADLRQKLPENTTLLQYFVGKDAVYCFRISRS